MIFKLLFSFVTAAIGLIAAVLLVTGMTGSLASAQPQQTDDASAAMAIDVQPSNEIEANKTRLTLSSAEAAKAHSAGLLPAGTKSLLNVPRTLGHGDYVWDDTDVGEGQVTVWVDLRRQMVSAFRDGHEIGTAVIVYGSPDKETPIGRFPILRKYRDYHSRSYDAPMPFSMFVTTDGVALHGSPMSATKATHGCVGLPIEFAGKLFDVAKKGDYVEIAMSKPTGAIAANNGERISDMETLGSR